MHDADRLAAALSRAQGPSSDYDLNPRAQGSAGRALRPAAVLVALWDGGVILTKRASHLQHHPGQIAFPGGKVDAVDKNAIAAALREAHEEIGLSPDDVDVLGTLPVHQTVTDFEVTPVLALVKSVFAPVRDPAEVEEVFTVPLSHLLDSANYAIESRMWRGQLRRYYVVPYGPYYIWGATARILRGLAERVIA